MADGQGEKKKGRLGTGLLFLPKNRSGSGEVVSAGTFPLNLKEAYNGLPGGTVSTLQLLSLLSQAGKEQKRTKKRKNPPKKY